MPVVPTGDPAWVRSSDFRTYGGHESKHNHLGQGAIDALTDVSAEEFSRLAADLAAIMRTAPFATITYLCNDTSPAAPTIEVVNSMVGIRTTPYAGNAAPAGFPSASRSGNGDVTFTWDSSYTDPYGTSGQFRVANPTGNIVGGTGLRGTLELYYDLAGAQYLQIVAKQNNGTAYSDARVTFTVYSG